MKLKDSPVLIQMARDLGFRRYSDAERAIRNYCQKKVHGIIESFGEIKDLNQLLNVVSSSLRMKFEEVHDDSEITEIAERYIAKGELFFTSLHRELDDKTDGMLVRLNNAKPWEPMFVAIIDCRGYKAWRAYFSKWHEIGHVLTLKPSQMTFQFRRIPVKKKAPGEQIVDRIAGDLAFYRPLFLPYLKEAVGETKRLTFDVVEKLRSTVCIGASREATLRGAVKQALLPQLLIIAGLGLKKSEEQILNSPQMGLFKEKSHKFEPKLRALEIIGNEKASDIGLRIHQNMQVPSNSVICEAFESLDKSGGIISGYEDLSWWEHSKGRLKNMPIWVEARESGDKVLALISQA
jgi:hypothetical protein